MLVMKTIFMICEVPRHYCVIVTKKTDAVTISMKVENYHKKCMISLKKTLIEFNLQMLQISSELERLNALQKNIGLK